MSVSVILACGGKGSRLGFDKLTYELEGVPVFIRSIRNFEEINDIYEIVIAAPTEKISEYEEIVLKHKINIPVQVVAGGKTRTQSVIEAFRNCNKSTKLIAVADGARPFTNPVCIRDCIKNARIFGASILGVPVKDTIKIVDDEFTADTPDRRKLFAVQTPQIFTREIYVKSVQFALDHELDFTDDASMAEAVGVKVHITKSDGRNIKITTPEDLVIAKAFAREKDV
jgi:2-C-methyl-D-erythritol 4-phosphate cytidylyltransferase